MIVIRSAPHLMAARRIPPVGSPWTKHHFAALSRRLAVRDTAGDGLSATREGCSERRRCRRPSPAAVVRRLETAYL